MISGTQSWIVKILSLLGVQIAGDVAGLTIYTNRRGAIVYYQKKDPEEPPSAMQQRQRDRFAAAINNWNALTPAQKAQWTLAANRASLCATGLNLFISASLSPNDHGLSALAARTHTSLQGATYCGW